MTDNPAFNELIEKESEVGCYLAMRSLGYMSWKLNHDAADGRIEDGKHIDASLKQFADYQGIVAKRIGTITGITVLSPNGKKVTPAYTQWYDRWTKYIESLPDEKVAEIGKRVNAGQDTSDVKLPSEIPLYEHPLYDRVIEEPETEDERKRKERRKKLMGLVSSGSDHL
jgi:hypothetical protein